MRDMKKLTSTALAAALSASLLVAPVATAAEGEGSSSSSNSVTRNRDNADQIPDGYEVPKQPPFGSAYTGSAPISVFLAAAATLAVLGAIAQYPPIQKELQKANKQWLAFQDQALKDLQNVLPLPGQQGQKQQQQGQ